MKALAITAAAVAVLAVATYVADVYARACAVTGQVDR